ncbi:MAG: response regulator [Nitrospirae bacterium]|nr:response regulator [Nitrospirota bacterium]
MEGALPSNENGDITGMPEEPKLKVLIADDNEDSRDALCMLLEAEGYAVELADNGIQALDAAGRSAPDLIISDVMMPEMDGFALCRAVKSDPRLRKIPFIFYTATYIEPSDEQLALDLGASRFVLKPVDPVRLLKIISEVFADSKEGRLVIPEQPLKDNRKLEESYTARLARKLDKKVRELEKERTELKEGEERYRALASRLREAEEAERKRVARELHDRCGQNLTALSINLNLIRSLLPADSEDKIVLRLNDSMALVEEIAAQVRDVTDNLRQDVLEDYGLVPALRWYGDRFESRTGVAVKVHADENSLRLPQAVESALFQISKEALNNVARHAEAKEATLTIEMKRNPVRLTVKDNGKGFDTSTVEKPEIKHGWGLLVMQERAQSMGGLVHIESEPGKGTRITVEVKI